MPLRPIGPAAFFALAPALAACGPRRPAARPAPCARPAVEVSNLSGRRVTVFAQPASEVVASAAGALLGDVAAGARVRFTLPPGHTGVHVQRELGATFRPNDIRIRMVCDAP